MKIKVVKQESKNPPEEYPKGLFTTDNYNKYLDIITRNDLSEMCQYGLEDSYIFECLDLFSFAVLLFDKKELQGIATVRNLGDHYFIDMICSSVSGRGEKILETIFEIAAKNGVATIRISALEELLNYYKRFDFKEEGYDSEEKEYHMVRTKRGGGRRKTRKR